jgi:hypothetical protein
VTGLRLTVVKVVLEERDVHSQGTIPRAVRRPRP